VLDFLEGNLDKIFIVNKIFLNFRKNSKGTKITMTLYKWKANLERERMEKDKFFATDWQSPISSKDKLKFNGLVYYPPDPNYRFELELLEHNNKKILQIQDTTGNVRNFIRWGEFRFELSTKEYTLQAYKSDTQEKQLFVPFKDTTNTKETYGAGRYLDLNYERDRTVNRKWVLDFNKAYNPWCAYSENYSCPFIDPENWLKVSILAGEKYSLKNMRRLNND